MYSKKIRMFLVISMLSLLPISGVYADKLPAYETRYMALGDSLVSGHGAVPATLGYPYMLYKWEVIDTIQKTNFANIGVPMATSKHVLDYQVPLAVDVFIPDVITLTVGGNDLITVLFGANLFKVLDNYESNLHAIFTKLLDVSQDKIQPTIYVSNLYEIKEIPPSLVAVPFFNARLNSVAGFYPNVHVVDVFSAFKDKDHLLLIERFRRDDPTSTEVHPTIKGYRVIAEAFEEVIRSNE